MPSCNQILLYCINYSSTRFVSLLFSVLLDHTLREVSILSNSMLIQRTYVLGQEVRVMRRYVFLQNFPFSLEFELFSVLLCIFVFVFLCYHFLSFTFLSFSPLSFLSFLFLSCNILSLYPETMYRWVEIMLQPFYPQRKLKNSDVLRYKEYLIFSFMKCQWNCLLTTVSFIT